MYARSNRLLYGIRFVQHRVGRATLARDTCSRHSKMDRVIHLDTACYNFSKQEYAEQSRVFGCTNVYNKETVGSTVRTCRYPYTDLATLGEVTTKGAKTSFPGSGYVVDIPLNKTAAVDKLRQMQGMDGNYPFVDSFTHSLIITFTSHNTNTNYFNRVTIIFEKDATGHLFKRMDFNAQPFLDGKAMKAPLSNTGLLAGGLLLALATIVYFVLCLLEMRKVKWNFWHAVELTNYALLWFHVLNVVQKYVLGTNARFFSGSPGNKVLGPNFVPTGSLFDFQALILEIYALNLLLSYMRLVKFFQMMTGVNMAVRVLGKVRFVRCVRCVRCVRYVRFVRYVHYVRYVRYAQVMRPSPCIILASVFVPHSPPENLLCRS